MTDSNNIFRAWMNERGLKTKNVASDLHVEEQTIRIWRSQGVPPRRMPHVERYMLEYDAKKAAAEVTAEAIEAFKNSDQIVLKPTQQQYDRWDQASRKSGAKSMKEWISNGLDAMADRELSPLVVSEAAEEVSPYPATAPGPTAVEHPAYVAPIAQNKA